MTEVVPGTLALRRGEERRSILLSAAEGHSFLSSAAGAFSFQRGRCILSSAAGVILFSARAVHSFICGGGAFILVICCRSIFFSARPVHPFICGTGASADQTAAAVGRQNACPSGAVLQPFRGRWQFEYAVRHTFPAKSRPLEAILYVHRPRSRTASPSSSGMPCLRFTKCLVFVFENTPPSPPELPCLRFTKIPRLRLRKCLASALRTASPSHYEISAQQRQISCVSGGGAFLSSAAKSFSCQRGRGQGILSSAAGAFSFQRGRGILSSAVPEYLLSRQLRPVEGKTHVHRARYCSHFAAVGSLRMPSATLSRQNRGRWKPFYMSTGRAHENTPPSPQKMPCLRFTNCLVFVSGNVPPPQDYSSPKACLMTSTESRSSHPKNWTFSRVFLPWMFISTLARYGLRPTWPYAAVGS